MATAAGYQIKDPAELSSFGEGDIARISGSSAIYRRDLAKEQEAMKTYTGGRGTTELDQAFNKHVYMGGSSGSTIQAAEVSAGLATGEVKPPASTADVLKEIQVSNAQNYSQSANTQLTIYQQQMADAKKQADEARAKLDELNKRRDTEVVAEYDKLSEPFRAEMEAAGNEEFKLKEKYQKYSGLASSLTTYAEQAYNDLQAEKARPGLTTLAAGRYNNIADDYNTKMTLTQVAMSALNDDIALGRTFIDRGIAAVEADKTDRLNYLSFVNDVISSDYSETYGEFQLANQEEKDAISNQIAVITNELNRLEEEKDMVAEFLIGDNAYVALQAGVNLSDSYDEMVQKVADYYEANPGVVAPVADKLETDVIKLEDGTQQLVNTQTGEVISTFGQKDLVMPAEGSFVTTALGDGTITGYGSDKWGAGLDFVLSGGKGAAVTIPQDFTVLEVVSNCVPGDTSCGSGFGNRVKVEIGGQEIWFSHLDTVNLSPGSYQAGEVIGTQGNTGNVYSLSGGDGTHLDITMPDGNGGYYTAEEVAQFLGVAGERDGSQTWDDLDTVSKFQAKATSTQIFGMRAGALEENYRLVGELMSQGLSIDEIKDNLRYSGYSPSLTGPWLDAAEKVSIGSLSAADTESFNESLERSLDNGDYLRATELLKEVAKKQVGVEQAKRIDGLEFSSKFLTDISGDLIEFTNNEGKLGIFSGTQEQIANKVGKTTDPELARIAGKISAAIIAYRKSMSGVAFTPEEAKQYKDLFPGIEKDKEFSLARVAGAQESYAAEIDTFYRQRMGSEAYDDLMGQQTSHIASLLLGRTSADGQSVSDDDAWMLALEAKNMLNSGVAAEEVSLLLNKALGY